MADLNTFPRPLTELETRYYLKQFPHIEPNTVTVIAAMSKQYNCISYSLGFTDRWIDVGATKSGLATMCSLKRRSGFIEILLISSRRSLLLRRLHYSPSCNRCVCSRSGAQARCKSRTRSDVLFKDGRKPCPSPRTTRA